jgi:hypothetical protein
MYAHAIDAVELTKRAFLQTSRSWVKATEQALAFPGDQPEPWTLVDLGFDSADLYVTVQTRFAKSLLEATAEVVGVAPVPAEPAARTEAVVEAPRAPKPAKRAVTVTKSPAPTTPAKPKVASPRRPAAGSPRDHQR